jgi:hypothetical protein
MCVIISSFVEMAGLNTKLAYIQGKIKAVIVPDASSVTKKEIQLH